MTDFRTLADLSSDPLLVAADGRVAWANAAARNLLAPAGGVLDGMPLDSLWQSDPLADDGRWLGDRLTRQSVRLRAADRRAVDLTARRTGTGDALEFMIAMRPVPSRARRAARVDLRGRQHAQRVMAAIDSAVDAIFVIDPRTLCYKPVPPGKLRTVMRRLLQA